MVSKQANATPLIDAEGEAVHQVVELRPAGQQQRTDLPDGLADDRHHQRDQQERPHARAGTEVGAVQRRGRGSTGRGSHIDDHHEDDRQHAGQPEREPRHRDRLVLPEVHVVQVDDVDDRDGERRHQDGDRQRTEDRGDQRDRPARWSSAIRYVCGRSPAPRGMIVETSANEATGSSGLAANDRRRVRSPERTSWPQTWQKCATSGSSASQRGQFNGRSSWHHRVDASPAIRPAVRGRPGGRVAESMSAGGGSRAEIGPQADRSVAGDRPGRAVVEDDVGDREPSAARVAWAAIRASSRRASRPLRCLQPLELDAPGRRRRRRGRRSRPAVRSRPAAG